MQILKTGSVGQDVRRLQDALNQCMLLPNNPFTFPALKRLVPDGRFGPKTEATVKEFQRLNQVKTDGIVGPITFYLIFPYITFKTELAGTGQIRGLSAGGFPSPLDSPNRNAFNLAPTRFGVGPTEPPIGPKPLPPAPDGAEREGLTLETTIAPGFKHEFKPYFVLNKPDDPEGPQSSATITAEATVFRSKGIEIGGEFEFSRPLLARGGGSWKWEGTLVGKYTNLKAESGPFSIGVSPIVELKIKQGIFVGAATGAEAEASIELSKDLLELSVGGKAVGQWDSEKGSVSIAGEVAVGLKLKWDVVRTLSKKK